MRADVQHGVSVYDVAGAARAVIKRKSNVPLVTIAIGARGGSHDEATTNAGLTSLVARTSIKGTSTRTAAQIAETAEAMGGSISPAVGADAFDWEISVPSRHFQSALELLADVAFNAAFPAAEFAVETKLALSDLQHMRDDMYRYPLRLCLQQAFRGHPYGNTMSSVERTLTVSDRTDAAAWHAQQVRRQPWVFIVGDVDPDQAAVLVERQLPQLQTAARPAPVQAAWPGASRVEETRAKAQTALALAFPAPTRNDEDAYVLQVLANAVGGLGGRFFEELRSRRSLAYTIALMPIARWLGGAFVAYIATSPEREDEARGALLEEFGRLKAERLPAQEVERAQRYTIGTWQIRSQTNGAQLADLLHACLLGPGVAEIMEYEQHIRGVTPESIRCAAERYFDAERHVEAVVRGTGAAR
ncbi:MAG TPA: pitrilysin family protein [Longimicrobiales bacterium]